MINSLFISSIFIYIFNLIIILSLFFIFKIILFEDIFYQIKLIFYYIIYLFLINNFPKNNSIYEYFLKLYSKNKYFENEIIFDNNNLNLDKTLLCYHPHGIIGTGFFFNGIMNNKLKKYNIKWGVSNFMLLFPFINYIMKSCNVIDVSKRTLTKMMENNSIISIIPGGFEEAVLTRKNENKVYLKNRKGFIKQSLKYGYKIRPVYTFGEVDTFNTINIFDNFRLKLSHYKIPIIFCWGKFILLPLNNNKLITVIGNEMIIPKIENPTNLDINKYHKIYIKNLKNLFKKYNNKINNNHNDLIVI